MSKRMNGKQPWTSTEIAEICKTLDIPQDEIGELFFLLSRKESPHENQIWRLVLAGNGLLCGGPAVRYGRLRALPRHWHRLGRRVYHGMVLILLAIFFMRLGFAAEAREKRAARCISSPATP
mgnify:CR=1 FL=1